MVSADSHDPTKFVFKCLPDFCNITRCSTLAKIRRRVKITGQHHSNSIAGISFFGQPLRQSCRDDFTDELLKITGGDTDAPVALICARGVRSRKMTTRLTQAGFTRIIDVPEGMLGSGAGPGWLRAKLPVSKP